MLLIRSHPSIPLLRRWVQEQRPTSIADAARRSPEARQHSVAQDNKELRASLDGLVEALLGALAVPSTDPPPQAEGVVSLRFYPASPPPASSSPPASGQRLGAHVDGNLCTLLYSTSPGLQVPSPSHPANRGITRGQVQGYGMPTLAGEVLVLGEERWAFVDARDDEILLTVGNEFFGDALRFPEKGQVFGPVLHRVHDGCMGGKERVSVPFLSWLKKPNAETK
ncbi:hypothetical protein TeGR_g2336 [Tetraparma gracilis]|uniref:Uncharacterized protein n=1 Tax=Tetraparma gracilis TaxID=2962635 RepID=A0ABQ6MTU0_9STRA|nr:hypothetical protein TeGR_g2336 [Tetraparma gracilis]